MVHLYHLYDESKSEEKNARGNLEGLEEKIHPWVVIQRAARFESLRCWELFCLEHGIQPDGQMPSDKTIGTTLGHLWLGGPWWPNGPLAPSSGLFL